MVKEPLRHRLLVNALDGPLDSRKPNHVWGHVPQRDPGVTRNGSQAIPAGLGPKALNHGRILPTLDIRPGEFGSRRSDICGLHFGVVPDEVRDIVNRIFPASSHEAGEVVDKIREDAVRHDSVLLEIRGAEIDGEASGGDWKYEWEC